MPTPKSVRVTAQGDLADWPEPGAAAEIEVYLPDTPFGPVRRIYTVRDWDRGRRAVTIDFTLNQGAGAATQWASRVVPGMWLEISGGSHSTFAAGDGADSYLLAGDESAVPAIATCVASLSPQASARVILDVADAGERQPLESLAQVNILWLSRDGGEGRFHEAVTEAVITEGPSQVWIAGEERVVSGLRSTLVEQGYPAGRLSVHTYWRQDTRLSERR